MPNDFSKIRAVIFDMDGVLFLSTSSHGQAWRKTMASEGIINFDYSTIAGMRTDDAMRKIMTENNKSMDDDTLNRLVSKKRKRALEFLVKMGEVAPGSAELIAELQKKYRLALATSASQPIIELFFEKSGYADAFESVVGGSLVKNSKPDPEIYLLTMQKLGLTPAECVVIEDAVNGVRAAVNAGVQVIAITGTDKRERLSDAGATFVVSNLKEIELLLA